MVFATRWTTSLHNGLSNFRVGLHKKVGSIRDKHGALVLAFATLAAFTTSSINKRPRHLAVALAGVQSVPTRMAIPTAGSVSSIKNGAGKLDVVLRQEHRAGEKLFVDYAGDKVPIVDSKTGTIQPRLDLRCRSRRHYTSIALTSCSARIFNDRPYFNLEPLDLREGVRRDPRGFLAQHRDGAVIDEIQNVPELLSYIQADVDEDSRPGRFVLTGSQHLGLSGAIAQSLAGRTAVFHLLPMSLDELRRFSAGNCRPADNAVERFLPADLRPQYRAFPLVCGLYDNLYPKRCPADRQSFGSGEIQHFSRLVRRDAPGRRST